MNNIGFINFFICTWAYLSVRIQVPTEQNKNMAKQGRLDHIHFLLSNSWTGNLLGNLLGKVPKALVLWRIHRDIVTLRLTDISFPPYLICVNLTLFRDYQNHLCEVGKNFRSNMNSLTSEAWISPNLLCFFLNSTAGGFCIS